MAEEIKVGCTRPETQTTEESQSISPEEKDVLQPVKEVKMIRVGQKAPDFTAAAYHKGKFISVKLSDYIGKWVVLCFYPGDFTFV